MGCIVRNVAFAIFVVLLLTGCGKTPSSDPFDLPTEPTRNDLVSAAMAAGFNECGARNDHGVTICKTGPGPTESIEIIDGDEKSAKSEYQTTCAANGPTQPAWDVWYGGSDWVVAVTAEFLGPDDVKAISRKLGDPQQCGS